MVEIVNFSLIVREDLDIGTGTRDLRLQDGSLVTAHQLSVPSLLIPRTVRLAATAGAAVLTGSALILAGARIAGVTTAVITALGATQALTGFEIGDPTISNRWGTQTSLAQDAETDQGDFAEGTWPVYPTTTDVLIQAVGGLFDGTGLLEVTVHYFFLTHRAA